MKRKQRRLIVTTVILTAIAAFAMLIGQHRLFAAEPGGQIPEDEQKYIAVLKSDAPLSEKARACQQLALVGTKNAVAVLAGLLDDETLGDYARFALEPIADPSVDEALRQAMGRLKGRLLAGVINSIGVRRDAEAVNGLSKLALDPASEFSGEAVAALGRIATDQAIEIIVQALSTSRPELRVAAADACLAGAERLLDIDKTQEAVKLYDAVRNADVPIHLRAAAAYGAITARGNDGIPLLIEQLRTDSPPMVEIALRAARQIPGPEVTEALVAELNKAKPVVQILLIKVLADRKDPAAYAAIKALAASDTASVRIESLKVLGELGDATAVPILLKAAAAKGDEAAIALAGLRILKGDGVDEAIMAGMKSAKDDMRPELINVLADRRCIPAIPIFLEQARDGNPTVARAALRGLGSLCSCQGLPKVIDALVETSDQAVREEALRAVIAITRRTLPRHESEITGLILQRLEDVDSVPAKCVLMRALPAAPGEGSLKWLQDASTDADGQIRDAAVRTIADYPDPAAAEALLNIFKSTKDKTHRIIALRGCIRLCKTTDIPVATAMNLYKQAMTQAETPAEKKLILSGLAETPHPDALRMALEASEQPSVKAEASLAAVALAQKICAIDPALASAVAKKILSDSDSANLHSQARTIIDTIGKFEDFIVAWQVAGPYSSEGSNYSQLLNMPFDPETQGKSVQWRPAGAGTNPEKPYLIDLLALFGGDQKVAYARTWINAGKGSQYTLNIGSDDGVKAWLNGKLVHTNDAARAAVADSDKVPLTLNHGWNCLMLKVTQNVLTWEFCARLTAPDGAKVEGIEVDCFHMESQSANN